MKKQLLTLSFVILALMSESQIAIQFDSTIAGNNIITTIDPLGNTYVVINNILVKRNPCGNTLWQKTLPCQSFNYYYPGVLKTDMNNDLIIIGNDVTYPIMYKYDKTNGNIINTVLLNAYNDFTEPHDILFDSNNNIIIIGAKLTNSFNMGFVTKYNSNFTLAWANVSRPNPIDKGVILNNQIFCLDGDNSNLYLRISSINLTNGQLIFQTAAPATSTDIAAYLDFSIFNSFLYTVGYTGNVEYTKINKMDTVGNYTTVLSLPGQSSSSNPNNLPVMTFSRIQACSSGLYVDADSSTYNTIERKILKIDFTGNINKMQTLKIQTMVFRSMTFINNKLYFYGGSYNPSISQGTTEKELNILDTALNITYVKIDTLMDPNHHLNYWTGLSLNNSGEFILRGTSSVSSVIQSYVRIYDNCTPTTLINEYNFKEVVNLSPNPTSNILNITGLTKNNIAITVTNVLGENVKTIETNGNTTLEINVEGLTTGVYFIKINNRSYKFIKS